MNIKNFLLSYYQNATESFHIQKVDRAYEAKKPHTHAYFQIYYVVKGSLRHFVDKKVSLLCQSDMFIVPPGTMHYVVPEAGTVFYSFSFMPDFLLEARQGGALIPLFLRNLLAGMEILPKVSIEVQDVLYIESLLARMLREFERKDIGFNEIVYAYAVLLVAVLARNYFERTALPERFENDKQFIRYCVEHVNNNFTENMTLEKILKHANMSKSSFCAAFRQLTGQSFHDYLNTRRIKRSTEYIKEGYKITAIYGLCGYTDFSTFHRNFKKIMGVSPKEYRLAIQGSRAEGPRAPKD